MATVNLKSNQNAIGDLRVVRSSLSSIPVVATGTAIRALHFNEFAGQTLLAATSASDAVHKAGYLWGVGYGDRGYGVTTPVLTTKKLSDAITSADWLNVRTILNSLASWQGSTITVPLANTFDAGDSVFATQPSALAVAAAIVDGKRLDSQAGNMTLATNAAQAIRATSWGSTPIKCSFTVELPTENQMRYFFNSGGDIRFSFEHSSTDTGRDIRWGKVLNTLVISFSANTTTQTAGAYAGLTQNIGYYQLTESWQTLFDGTNMSAYIINTNDVTLEARSTYIEGLNGAKGRVIEFRVTLGQDEVIDDVIAPGTIVNLSHLRATTTIVIPSLTCTVTEAL